MLTIYYGNCHETKAKYRSIAVYPAMYAEIQNACKGHFGFGGENVDSYYVDVSEWNKCLEIINAHIEQNGTVSAVYRQQVTPI